MTLSSFAPRVLAAAVLFVSISSCSENLDSSGVCGVLCPPIGGEVKTITLDAAVVVDTTVQSFSGLGTEPGLLLAARGDTLDTRVIIRFDSLPDTFTPTGGTVGPITSVDSAYIQLRVDTLSIKGAEPVTIEAYDVDTTANDTSTAAVLALFRPDRFISSQTFARAELKDTLKYFISNAVLLAKIQANTPFRVGLRATGPGSSQMLIRSTETGATAPVLWFRATPDTNTKPIAVATFSTTPAGEPILAANLSDYTVIAKAPPPGSPSDLVTGGLPPRRIYIRFDIPSSIIDSQTVVRATLLLNQLPNPLLDPGDTVLLLPHVGLAGKVVTDPVKAAQIIAGITVDTLRLTPGGAGTREVELASAFALWRTQKPDVLPRAIILRTITEGSSPLQLRFSSSEEIAALRPRLRISYTSQVPLRLP